MTGPRLEVLAGRTVEQTRTELLLRARAVGDEAGRVALASASAVALASRLEGAALSTPVIARLAAGECPTVVVQGNCDQLFAFQPSREGPSGRTAARVPGHGISTGSGRLGGGASLGGVVLADLLGDGTLATLAATTAADGHARLVAYGPAHQVLWGHDFDDLPGAAPEWNIGGLTLWFAGRFTDPHRDDVLVNIRRSTMHSDETFLLDGRTGRELWHRVKGGNAAGNQAPAAEAGGLSTITTATVGTMPSVFIPTSSWFSRGERVGSCSIAIPIMMYSKTHGPSTPFRLSLTFCIWGECKCSSAAIQRFWRFSAATVLPRGSKAPPRAGPTCCPELVTLTATEPLSF